ncbi:hypothetical protein GCK32_007626 [Trichostrongylus colubriformis]|uniref:Uncharacterized protein n=1 Tax=Trichostrongylus colubriformis TaxID=6319 RepID=A0AAN8IYB2_TRICO
MFAHVARGVATLMQLRHSLFNQFQASISEPFIEFEPDISQLLNTKMEEHEMWSKSPLQKESIQMRNNRRMPQPLSEKDRSYIAGIIFASVLAVTLITIAIVMWACII